MVMLLFGCANMNTLHLPNCRRLVERIRAWLASHTGKLSTAQSLSNAAWSLACLDMLDKQLLRKVSPPLLLQTSKAVGNDTTSVLHFIVFVMGA